MASIRNTAQRILEEAREGIAWIAFFREGRGWEASCFWPDIDKGGSFEFEEDDAKEIKSILSRDRNAIFVNSYYTNLGELEGMTRDTLANALRWQYESGYNQLADAQPGVAGSRPTRSEDGRAERKDSGNEKNQEDQRLPGREVQRPGKAGQRRHRPWRVRRDRRGAVHRPPGY